MNLEQVMKELEKMGSEQTKKVLGKHGAKEPFFGVKIGDMKKILKSVRGDQQLAYDLYETGNGDAMYFAGLLVDGAKMTKAQINKWANKANWYMLSEYTVPWVAAENGKGWDLALEWIESKKEKIASGGWATLSMLVATRPDDALDIKKLRALLKRVGKEIHTAENRVRYTMNQFVISVASYVAELSDEAIAIAEKNGKVEVNLGGTACKVPYAPDYIQKVIARYGVGKKRKEIKC